MLSAVLVEVHANLNDNLVESELVFRWREIAAKMASDERITVKEWDEFHRIKEDLNCQLSESVKVWLLCRTEISVSMLQQMITDNRLRDIVIRLFKCLLKHDGNLMKQFQNATIHFKYAGIYSLRYFTLAV